MKKIFCLTLIGVFFLGSCNKYPDGPFISLRSVADRIQGVWTVSAYVVDGTDSTTHYNNLFGGPCSFDFGDPEDDAVPKQLNIVWGTTSYPPFTMQFSYSFGNSNKAFSTGPINSLPSYVYGYNPKTIQSPINDTLAVTYQFLKLEYLDVWFKANDYGHSYEFHLSNVKKY